MEAPANHPYLPSWYQGGAGMAMDEARVCCIGNAIRKTNMVLVASSISRNIKEEADKKGCMESLWLFFPI